MCIRDRPTSVPACSVKRLFGSRMADTGSQRFFMKSVDMVREGGLVAFITSQGVLNLSLIHI